MNNNITNNCGWIGSTHIDNIKLTSNILEQHIIAGDLNSSNYTSNAINILNTNSSNYTSNASNILNTNSSNYTNILRYDVNKWINEEYETSTTTPPINLTHTYIYSSNLLSEIRFLNTKAKANFPLEYIPGTPNYKVKIDVDGKLKLYYVYDILISSTWFSGWIDPTNMLVGLVQDGINQGGLITGLETQITGLIEDVSAIIPEISIIQAQIADLEAQTVAGNLTNQPSSILEQGESIRNFGSPASSIQEAQATQELQNINSTVVQTARAHNTTRIAQMGAHINQAVAQNPITSFALGFGSTGVAIVYGIYQNLSIDNFLNRIVERNINSNIFLSLDKKRELLELNSNVLVASNLIDMTVNYYKLGITQGFINSNITDQQYIANLKCDNLNLNTGNITNINGIAANELIANGKIKQNNILLDDTYLTSNHLYNLAYTYTAERQYPPKLYNNTSTEDTVSLLGKLVYHQTLYLDNQTIAYGSGIYELYSSSSYDLPTTKDRLFNFNTTETTTSPRWAISLYNSGTGNYQGDNSIDNVYFGDWIILKLPQPILLTRYRIYQRSDFLTKAPAEWKVYGSNDGITFTEITEASQTTRLTSYTGGYYEKSLNPSFTTLYQYIGFVFGSLLSVSGQSDLSFSELQIFGKEIISNSITSQIYTTSNAVREIIKNDSIFAKHYGFYITISTPIVINGTTFYKYDIDLRQYTKLGVIQIGPQSGDTFRSFKIRLMYATMYFSYIINDLPNVCYYEVFMSYKNTASPPNGVAGLNACSIGFPPNPTLQAVMPNNLFVVKNGQGDINYITAVSSSPADCRVIVEDLIG